MAEARLNGSLSFIQLLEFLLGFLTYSFYLVMIESKGSLYAWGLCDMKPGLRFVLKWSQVCLMLFVLVLLGLMLWRDFSAQAFQDIVKTLHWSSLSWALLAFALGLALKAERLFYLSRSLNLAHRRLDCLQYQIVSISLAIITPVRAGEFYKAFLLAGFQREKLPVGTLIMLVERLADLIVLTLLGALMAAFIILKQGQSFAWLVLVLFVLLVVLLLMPLFFFRLFDHLKRFLPEKIQGFISELLQHKEILRKGLLPLTLWTFIIWGVEGLFQWSIFNALGAPISIWAVVGISALVSLAGVLSLLPIGLGMVDLSSLLLYSQILHLGQEQVVLQVNLARVLGLGGLYILLLAVLLISPKLVKNAFYKRHKDSEGPPEVEPELK